MSFGQLQEILESDDVYAQASVANDVPSFIQIISRLDITKALRLLVGESRENANRVTNYARTLFEQASDNGMRFENDVALAICLYVLSGTAFPRAGGLIRSILSSNLRPLIWAGSVVRHLTPKETVSLTTVISFEQPKSRPRMRVPTERLRLRGTSTIPEKIVLGAKQ